MGGFEFYGDVEACASYVDCGVDRVLRVDR